MKIKCSKKVVESLSASLPCRSPQRDQPARVCAAPPLPRKKNKKQRTSKVRRRCFDLAADAAVVSGQTEGRQWRRKDEERTRGGRKGPEGRTGTGGAGPGSVTQRMGRADWFGFHAIENSKRVSSIRFCALVGAGSRGPYKSN